MHFHSMIDRGPAQFHLPMPRTTHYPLSTSRPGARLYHSTASVWLSVDPLSDKYPSVSPYVYCANNPVRLVDPDGRDWWVPDGSSQPVFDPSITRDNCPKGQYLGRTCNWQEVNLEKRTVSFCYGDENGEITRNELDFVISPQNDEYSISKAVGYIQDHAEPHSVGLCARYTVNAIEAGGVKIKRTNSAKDLGPSLESAGFVKMDIDYHQAIKGDVAIFQAFTFENKQHPHGHAQMFDGQQWISDFRQNDFWPGSAYRKAQPVYHIYRR